MKLRTSSKLVVVSLLFLIAPSLMFASSATVDCNGVLPGTFATITAALASFAPAGPNSIQVTCNTSDNVLIVGFSNLTIFSALPPGPFTVTAANPNRRVMNITNSTNVFIDGISFSGGRGVFINNSNGVQIGDGTVQNSSLQGMAAILSVVDIFNLTIQNNTRSGVSAQGGTFSLDGGVTIQNNARFGIAMLNGHLLLNGGDGGVTTPDNVISNNTAGGVAVEDSAECDAGGGNSVIGNGATGLTVIHTSTVLWGDGTISSNTGIGVHCGETSHCEWFGTAKINNNGGGGIEITDHSDGYIDGGIDISGNTGAGVLVDLGSVFNSLGGDTINNNTDDGVIVNDLSVLKFAANDTITGNGKLALECDNGSLVVGDVSTYKPKKCGPAFQAKPIK